MSDVAERLGAIEQWVVAVGRELKLPIGTLDDDFFDVGGTSLTLMRLIARTEVEFGIFLEPDDVLESSTLRGIAGTIHRNVQAADADRD